jgi:hypothetical protein
MQNGLSVMEEGARIHVLGVVWVVVIIDHVENVI